MEPPPNALMERGFITPTSLHYVRNHGPVPKLSWDTHRLHVGAYFTCKCLVFLFGCWTPSTKANISRSKLDAVPRQMSQLAVKGERGGIRVHKHCL